MGDDEDDRSVPYFFPDDRPLRFTLQTFPHSEFWPTAVEVPRAAVKDAAGAPWACCVSPFVDAGALYEEGSGPPPPVPIDRVARCEECFAYISLFSDFTSRYWKCALCGHMSRFTQELSRYRRKNAFQVLPELAQETVEFELPLDSKGAMMRSGEVLLESGYLAKEPAAARPIVYLAVLDETGGPEYQDAMAEVLHTCAQSLPDDCRLGVVTVSDRIGLVDLGASMPHVQFVDMGLELGAGGEGGKPQPQEQAHSGAVKLSDVMSLEELLCPLGEHRTRISANVGGLRRALRSSSSSGSKGAGAGAAGTRATGLAVKLLLDLVLETAAPGVSAGRTSTGLNSRRSSGNMPPAVESGRGFSFAGCRLMLFLAGPPNRGSGALGATLGVPEGGNEGFVHDQLFRGESKALGFYRGQAYRAASCGVSVDVHSFTSEACDYVGLSSLAPLAMTTGGVLRRHSLLHQRPGEARAVALGAEVCEELLRPRVYDGLLRVRTSAEFNVNRDGVYGNLSADPRLENLWHVASCSTGQSFAMDFEFRGGGGGADLQWDDEADTSSTVQSAFAYTAVIPDPDAAVESTDGIGGDQGAGKTSGRMVTVRRLRVTTVKTEASPSVKEVASGADPAAVTAVLTHKVVSEARRSGFAEARGLLRDWLANFMYGLSQNLTPRQLAGGEKAGSNGSAGGPHADDLSRRLASHPLVVGMVRQVFGLLHSPLLHPTRGFSDERVSLLSRLTSLDADALSVALYPEMQGYATPDVRLANSLSLSREAVGEASSACRIYVVDTFWRVVIHYVDSTAGAMAGATGAAEAMPFPPPRESGIGQFLELRSVVRRLAGQEVVYSRLGTPEAFFFEEALLEDRPLPKTEKEQTFKEFLSDLLKDVAQD